MEGTNAKVTLPDRQQSSSTSSPGATFTPSFQTHGPLWKTMVSKFEQLAQSICEFAHLPLEGTNAKTMTSQIGCISPRRQARGRRTLQISKFTNQTFQDDFTTTFPNFKKFILCPPFHTHSSSCPFYRPFILP